MFERFKKTRVLPFISAYELTGKLWVRVVDLPGYRDWAANYDRLERIIPDLENYHIFVPPNYTKELPPGYFEKIFQGNLDAAYNHFSHLDIPRTQLEEYRLDK